MAGKEEHSAAAAAAGERSEGEDGGEGGVDVGAGKASGEHEPRQWSNEEWAAWNQWWEGNGWSFNTGDSSAADPLQVRDPWQRSAQGAASSAAVASGGGDHWKEKDWWKKGDYSEPPSWAGWGHYRLWRKSILRWDGNTDVAVHRRAEKILKSLDWGLQEKLDHIAEAKLASQDYLQEILYVLDILAGEKETSERRRTIRAALYEGARKADESLAEYSLRREAQFQSAAQYLSLPDELKAFMMEEQAGLSRQSLQNLRVLTEGKHEFTRVKKALQIIDTEEEPLVKSNKQSFLGHGLREEAEQESDEEDYLANILEVIDKQELEEERAMSFLTMWSSAESEEEAMSFLMDASGGGKGYRRSWSENKLLKAARKKDRRHFDDRSSRGKRPASQRRLPIEELKKVTRCSNCGDKGHWREDCKQPYRSKAEREKREKEASAFVFLGTNGNKAASSCGATWNSMSYFDENKTAHCFFDIPAGHAIIDPGAAQDLIGWKKFQELKEKLRQRGLRPVILDEEPPGASGIGGSANPKFNALTPCMLGGHPGLVKVTVVEQDIPQLLSIGLLEHTGAIIDTKHDTIEFDNLKSGCKMKRLPSGHRIIDIADWSEDGPFPVPENLLRQYGLRPDAFELPKNGDSTLVSARGVYMSDLEQPDTCKYLHGLVKESLLNCWNVDMYGNPVIISSSGSALQDKLEEKGFLETEGDWLCSAWIETPNETKQNEDTNAESVMSYKSWHVMKPWTNEESRTKRAVHVFFRHEDLGLMLHRDARAAADFSDQRTQGHCQDQSHRHGSVSPAELCSSDSQRARSRSGSRLLVSADLEDAEAVPGNGQHIITDMSSRRCTDARGDPENHPSSPQLSTPSDLCEEGGKPTRHVGEMCGMQHQVELQTILGEPSSTTYQEEGCHGHSILASECCGGPAGNEPKQWVRGKAGYGSGAKQSSTADFSGNSVSGLPSDVANDGSHAERDVRTTSSESTASGAIDWSAGTTKSDAAQPKLPGNAADHDGQPEPSSDGGFGNLGDGGQRGRRLGERGDASALWNELSDNTSKCFTSLKALEHIPLNCTESVGWFVCRLQPHTLDYALGDPDVSQSFLIQEKEGLSICYFNRCLGFDVHFDDSFDREVQLSRTVKKSIAEQAQSLLAGIQQLGIDREPELYRRVSGITCGSMGSSSLAESVCSQEESKDQETSSHWDKARTQRHLSDAKTSSHGAKARTPRGQQGPETASHRDKARTLEEGKTDVKHSESYTSSSELPFKMVETHHYARGRHDDRKYKILELFSPPRISAEAQRQGIATTQPPNFDLTEGWDFFSASDRAEFWRVVHEQEPDCILISPDCKAFTVLMESNWGRMNPEKVKEIQVRGMAMFQFCIQVAEHQLTVGKEFMLEQPGSASSWGTHAMNWLLEQAGVARIVFDQCAAGLQVCEKGLSQKPTGIVSNHLGILARLVRFQCSGDHSHVALEGGLPHKARVYPRKMVAAIVKGIYEGLRQERDRDHPNYFDDDEEGEIEDMHEITEVDRTPATPAPGGPKIEKLSEEQIKKVMRVHVNLGHISKDQMLTLFRAAGAKDTVMEFIKNKFKCSQCDQQRRPVERKRATLPRTFAFNRQVAIDIFYVSFQGRTLAFLNTICLGTNLQQVMWIRESEGGTPSSKLVWRAFSQMWLRPFGVPEALLCDGGTEFKDAFERGLEQIGTMQVICDATSPWQNGRVERHGGWVKEKAEQELSSGGNFITNAEDLENMLIYLVCHKNRWFNKGGYSPYQLVFGQNPSIPSDLLGDRPQDLAWQDIEADPLDQDTAAAEFSRTHRIRQRARELCVQHNSKEKIRLSSSQRCHVQRNWSVGQWVYVWRRAAGSGQGHITRSRWIGPGIVILQSGHTVFVSMRARLWRCNSDQLREANHYEAVGGELGRVNELQDLIRQGHRSKAGAIDVASEGSPPAEAELHPLPQGHPQIASEIQESSVRAETPLFEQPDQPQELPRLPGQGQSLRNILAPIPEDHEVEQRRQSVQSSLRSLPEPLEEPDHQGSPVEPHEKKRRTSKDDQSNSSSSSTPRGGREREVQQSLGRVKRQVSELEEQERLNKIALRELRRLDREERTARALRREDEPTSSGSQAIPTGDDRDEEPIEEDALLSYLELKLTEEDKDKKCFMVKPVKPKNSEFDMRSASEEEK